MAPVKLCAPSKGVGRDVAGGRVRRCGTGMDGFGEGVGLGLGGIQEAVQGRMGLGEV